MGIMLALTEQDETNTLVCRLGRKLLGMDTAYQVVNTFLSDVTDEVLMNFGGLPAFDMKISISALNDRLTNHRLEVRTLDLEASDKGLVLPDKLLFSLFFFIPFQFYSVCKLLIYSYFTQKCSVCTGLLSHELVCKFLG